MYGVPAKLELDCLIGAELYGIHVYRYDVQFVFYNGLRFMVMSTLVLLEHGREVAAWSQETGWSTTAFQKLLHETATGFRVPDEHTLVLQFESGHELFLLEDERYESIQIFEPGAAERPRII